jgi:hypothetical protein
MNRSMSHHRFIVAQSILHRFVCVHKPITYVRSRSIATRFIRGNDRLPRARGGIPPLARYNRTFYANCLYYSQCRADCRAIADFRF